MERLRTAEIRWFHVGRAPAAVAAWFDALGPPVEPASRTDRYLRPTDAALGVKLREGRVEAKRRDGTAGPLAAATIETWTKWSFALSEAPEVGEMWVEVAKVRRQREHAVGDASCRLELSEVGVGGEVWWSVCLEADGPSVEARRHALASAAARWLGRADAPALAAADARGYPAWLMEVAG